MKNLILITSILISLCACTAKYEVIRHGNKKLSMSDSYFISKPLNGKYGKIKYDNSGEMTRDALYNELIMLGVKTEKADATRTKEISLTKAKKKGFDILLFSTILHWEDRATEWSGARDRVKISLELVDTETEMTIDNSVLNLVGTWWTFGGLHPQDMVNEAVEKYFQQLFQLDKQ